MRRNLSNSAADRCAKVMSVEVYMGWRYNEIFLRMLIPLLQTLALPKPLSDAELQHPDVRRLEDLVVLSAVCHNDIASYAKESALSSNPFNLVLIIQKSHSTDEENAFAQTIETSNSYHAEFVDLLQLYPRDGATKAYADVLQIFILALIDWSFSSPRYHMAEQSFTS